MDSLRTAKLPCFAGTYDSLIDQFCGATLSLAYAMIENDPRRVDDDDDDDGFLLRHNEEQLVTEAFLVKYAVWFLTTFTINCQVLTFCDRCVRFADDFSVKEIIRVLGTVIEIDVVNCTASTIAVTEQMNACFRFGIPRMKKFDGNGLYDCFRAVFKAAMSEEQMHQIAMSVFPLLKRYGAFAVWLLRNRPDYEFARPIHLIESFASWLRLVPDLDADPDKLTYIGPVSGDTEITIQRALDVNSVRFTPELTAASVIADILKSADVEVDTPQKALADLEAIVNLVDDEGLKQSLRLKQLANVRRWAERAGDDDGRLTASGKHLIAQMASYLQQFYSSELSSERYLKGEEEKSVESDGSLNHLQRLNTEEQTAAAPWDLQPNVTTPSSTPTASLTMSTQSGTASVITKNADSAHLDSFSMEKMRAYPEDVKLPRFVANLEKNNEIPRTRDGAFIYAYEPMTLKDFGTMHGSLTYESPDVNTGIGSVKENPVDSRIETDVWTDMDRIRIFRYEVDPSKDIRPVADMRRANDFKKVDAADVTIEIPFDDPNKLHQFPTSKELGYFMANMGLKRVQVLADKHQLFNAIQMATAAAAFSAQKRNASIKHMTGVDLRIALHTLISASKGWLKEAYSKVKCNLPTENTRNFRETLLPIIAFTCGMLKLSLRVVTADPADGTSLLCYLISHESTVYHPVASIIVAENDFWHVCVPIGVDCRKPPGFAEHRLSYEYPNLLTDYVYSDGQLKLKNSSKIIASYLHFVGYVDVFAAPDGNCGFTVLEQATRVPKDEQLTRYETFLREQIRDEPGLIEVLTKGGPHETDNVDEYVSRLKIAASYHLSMTELQLIGKALGVKVKFVTERQLPDVTAASKDAVFVIYHEGHFELAVPKEKKTRTDGFSKKKRPQKNKVTELQSN